MQMCPCNPDLRWKLLDVNVRLGIQMSAGHYMVAAIHYEAPSNQRRAYCRTAVSSSLPTSILSCCVVLRLQLNPCIMHTKIQIYAHAFGLTHHLFAWTFGRCDGPGLKDETGNLVSMQVRDQNFGS